MPSSSSKLPSVTAPRSPIAVPPWVDRALYPFTPWRHDTPEGPMAYIDEGAGPPVLLVHGTPSWSFEWRGVISGLAADHRVIAPDLMGFGLSARPRAGLGVADHTRRLVGLVEALGLAPGALTMVVHDFGGPIGLPLALAGRVGQVVVVNSWMWPSDGDAAIARLDRVVRSPLGRLLYRWLGLSARVLLPRSFGVRARLTKPVHRHYLGPLRSRGEREGTYRLALELRGADPLYKELWEQRARLRGRVSLVWGERDPFFTSVHRARWQEAFPEARVSLVGDAGHFVAEERPDVVAAAAREAVLRGVGGKID